MIFTNPSGKRGVVSTSKKNCGYDKASNNQKGGSAGFFNQLSSPSQHSCSSSYNIKQVRSVNILNNTNRLISIHSPVFDTCLSQTQLNYKEV